MIIFSDKVFGPSTTTEAVYDVAARPVVKGAMEGINGTPFFTCLDHLKHFYGMLYWLIKISCTHFYDDFLFINIESHNEGILCPNNFTLFVVGANGASFFLANNFLP